MSIDWNFSILSWSSSNWLLCWVRIYVYIHRKLYEVIEIAGIDKRNINISSSRTNHQDTGPKLSGRLLLKPRLQSSIATHRAPAKSKSWMPHISAVPVSAWWTKWVENSPFGRSTCIYTHMSVWSMYIYTVLLKQQWGASATGQQLYTPTESATTSAFQPNCVDFWGGARIKYPQKYGSFRALIGSPRTGWFESLL